MTAYYNEIDPYAAQWLRNLISAGHIAPGHVDTRSIEDVRPPDLAGFTQCHFFAGVGVWSHALRGAGWADSNPVWSGSCPCQPFSAAGKGAGFDDQRHLWPAWQWLISQCKPPIIFGEQVASKDAGPWIDLVQADVEAMGYAFGAIPFPSAGVGAPHIRDRLYWVADSIGERRAAVLGKRGAGLAGGPHGQRPRVGPGPGREAVGLADTDGRHAGAERKQRGGQQRQQPQDGGAGVGLADAGHDHDASEGEAAGAGQSQAIGPANQPGGRCSPSGAGAGPTNGIWRDADWLGCRDGRWRPVEPGTFPLAHGAAARVGRLRAYGNAICSPAAQAFIEAAQ